MAVQPISPKVTLKGHNAPDVTAHMATINQYLSAPWTDYERSNGRFFDIGRMTIPERDTIMDVYTRAGWRVEFQFHQIDGDAIRFRPPVYRGREG